MSWERRHYSYVSVCFADATRAAKSSAERGHLEALQRLAKLEESLARLQTDAQAHESRPEELGRGLGAAKQGTAQHEGRSAGAVAGTPEAELRQVRQQMQLAAAAASQEAAEVQQRLSAELAVSKAAAEEAAGQAAAAVVAQVEPLAP